MVDVDESKTSIEDLLEIHERFGILDFNNLVKDGILTPSRDYKGNIIPMKLH